MCTTSRDDEVVCSDVAEAAVPAAAGVIGCRYCIAREPRTRTLLVQKTATIMRREVIVRTSRRRGTVPGNELGVRIRFRLWSLFRKGCCGADDKSRRDEKRFFQHGPSPELAAATQAQRLRHSSSLCAFVRPKSVARRQLEPFRGGWQSTRLRRRRHSSAGENTSKGWKCFSCYWTMGQAALRVFLAAAARPAAFCRRLQKGEE